VCLVTPQPANRIHAPVHVTPVIPGRAPTDVPKTRDDVAAGWIGIAVWSLGGYYARAPNCRRPRRWEHRRMLPTADDRLATYGSLAPGRANHHHVAGLRGRWSAGVVRGRLVADGWGAALGYPALVLDPDGPEVDVQVLESADLPAHWARLDDFEGPGYQRVVTTVRTATGEMVASIYVLTAPADR
jgi:gamma-glutamylcyclotransferase (GGCT)/AIG2-like uncharacterized protein YtfP